MASTRIELDEETVRLLWEILSSNYRSKVVRKDEGVMGDLAELLGRMGVLDTQDFLTRYTTTLGDTIHVPFEVGSRDRDLWSQCVLCVHEHVHVEQARRWTGGLGFALQYVISSASRAAAEAEAFAAEMEMHWWWNGTTGNVIDDALSSLRDYLLAPKDMDFVREYLLAHKEATAEGAMISPVAGFAIEALEDIG